MRKCKGGEGEMVKMKKDGEKDRGREVKGSGERSSREGRVGRSEMKKET